MSARWCPSLSHKDIEHSYDLIAALEGLSVREATPFITAQHLERLELVIDKMEIAEDAVAVLST